MKKKIVVFSNDSFYYQNKFLYYQNKNTQTIIDILNSKYDVHLISRESLKKTTQKKKIKEIEINKIKSLIQDIKKNRDLRFLFISITPFNFIYFILLKIFLVHKKQIFVFLRSDGFKEYQVKLPLIGYYIYSFMFKIFGLGSRFLSCSKYFEKIEKFKILLPSELDNLWLKKDFNKKIHKKICILYVGRFRKEKGYTSLINIFKKMNKRLDGYSLYLTLVGSEKKEHFREKNIKIIKQVNNDEKLKKIYDSHQIFILPSYTEGYPQVILESFSRKKPVIIFNEIKFLKKIFPKGLFVSERNEIACTKTIKHILSNYNKIIIEIDNINLTLKRNYKFNLIKHLQG